MHYIDRLIKFISLFFVFCCFSQVSFGQIDTLLYETFDNGIPEEWNNVGDKWSTTTGQVKFEPSSNSEKGELIMPIIETGSNDSIILELNHNFICDVTKGDSLYIDVSYDGGISYKDRLLIKEEDLGNPTFNLTEELPNIVNSDSIILKYVAILHENLDKDVKWNLDEVKLYKLLGGNYKLTASSDGVNPGADRQASIPIDCLPSNKDIPINLSLFNKGPNDIDVSLSDIIMQLRLYEENSLTHVSFIPISIIKVEVDDVELTSSEYIDIYVNAEVVFNVTINLGVFNIPENQEVKLYINVHNSNPPYLAEVQIDDCCQENSVVIAAEAYLPLLTASQSFIETEEANIDETESIIIVSTNDIVYFEAADFIELNAGFETATNIGNGEFLAYIDDCSSELSSKREPILDNETNVSLSLYPNPVDNIFYIEYYLDNDSEVNASLFDVTGKLKDRMVENKFNLRGNQKVMFNIETLNSGLYIFKIQTDTWEKNVKILKL